MTKGENILKYKSILIVIFTLAIATITVFSAFTALSVQNDMDKILRVEDYFPTQKIRKEFTGGFENSGYTHTIDKFEQGKAQLKQLDTGTGVVMIYEISQDEIRIISSQEVGDGNFRESYLDSLSQDRNNVILKSPLRVGTKWSDDMKGEIKITGVNVKVKTPIGKFYGIKVEYKAGDFDVTEYYVKGLGLVKKAFKNFWTDELIKVDYLDE